MASNVDICNLALSHLGSGKNIANLETEKSKEAQACRTYFEMARDVVLRDFPWPFATRFATLALVVADPTTEWAFSYQYPSDCTRLRRILSGVRNDDKVSRVPYKLANTASGTVIYTDLEEAVVEYTYAETDAGKFDADFVMALSFRLAVYLAPRVTGGDPFKLQNRMMSLYVAEMAKAQGTSSHEEQPDEPPESEFIRARE